MKEGLYCLSILGCRCTSEKKNKSNYKEKSRMDGEGSNKKPQHSGLGGSNSHFPDTLVVSIDLKVKDDNRCISDNKCLAVSSTSAFMGH